MTQATTTDAGRDIRHRVAGFEQPALRKSIWQSVNSIGGFLAVTAAMYATAGTSYWIALSLAPLAAGFLVRTFIIQHDCGHGAFFHSRRWNDRLGFICSLLTLAPYASWRRQHAGHHGVWNNLDRRQTGVDIYSSCLTLDEYRSLSPWRRRWYRFSRSSIIANLIVPPLVFLILFRLPFDMPAKWRRERRAVYITNLLLVGLVGGMGIGLGFGRVAEIQLPIVVMASIVGVWLFSVQHRSDHTIWARQDEWDATTASLHGTTYLRLSPILQWFTGNIGLHHVHHLNPKIPNFRLQSCHDAIAQTCDVPVMTLGLALKSTFYVLWDERRQKMVTFGNAAGYEAAVHG